MIAPCPHCYRMEEEIRHLKRELGIRQRDGEIGALIIRLGVTELQARLLIDLHKAGGRPVREEALALHLTEDALISTVKAHIYRIRKRLGLDAITTAWRGGYGLSPKGWSLVHAALRPPEMQEPRGLPEDGPVDNLGTGCVRHASRLTVGAEPAHK